MSFSALLDTFKGFFSRAFWFASFLPVAIVCAIHAILYATFFKVDMARWITGNLGKDSVTTLAMVAGLTVLAYAISPLTPVFAGLFDGSLLPQWLHDWLRRGRAASWRKANETYRTAAQNAERAMDLSEAMIPRLQDARAAGRTAAPGVAATVEAAIAAAEAAARNVDEIATAAWNRSDTPGRPIDLPALEQASILLETALAFNPANVVAAAGGKSGAQRLADCQLLVTRLLREARNEHRHSFEAIVHRLPVLDPQDWQATRLGDARYARERYTRDAYRAPFAYIWPRVRMVMETIDDNDAKGLPRQVSDAAVQLDFSILLLSLSITIPGIWPFVLVGLGLSVTGFVLIASISPIVIGLLYELVVRNDIAFGKVLQTAIDRHRLGVFPMLKLAAPATLSAERDLWTRLAKVEVIDSGVDFVYVYPKEKQA